MTVHKLAKTQVAIPSKLSKIVVFAFAAVLVGASANAAATYATDDDGATLVVTVDSGTESLDAMQVASGITKIVKRGEGTLAAVPIASYTGDFDIEKGIWQCKKAGDFGATSTTASSGAIWVRDGASIEIAPADADKNGGFLSGKTVHLYGAAASGASGGGKIWYNASLGQGNPGCGENTTVVLHDNATIHACGDGNTRLRLNGRFDLGGHILTLKERAHDVGGVITNGGAVVLSTWSTWMTETVKLTFAADCAETAYVEVGSGCTFNVKGSSQSAFANGWKVFVKGGQVTANVLRFPTSTNASVWEGPIEFSGNSTIARYALDAGSGGTNWGLSNTVFNAKGPISGTGKITCGPGWLNLFNADNTYSGSIEYVGKSKNQTKYPVPPGGGGIGVWNGASAFPNASSITLSDSAQVAFMDDTAATVGPLVFIGDTQTYTGDPGDDTQSITGGSATNRSTIAGITKTGTNVLVVASPVHVTGKAKISEGTLKIPFLSVKGTPGLYETHVTPVSPGDPKWDDGYVWEGSWNGSNGKYRIGRPWLENYQQHLNYYEKGVCKIGPQRAVMPMANGNSTWSDGCTNRNGWWYHGYIWNNTDAPVTYTFWHGFNGDSAIFLGEDHETLYDFLTGAVSGLSDGYVGRPSAAREITFQPGATPIDVYVWNHGGYNWLREVPSVSVRYGFAFAPSSVCSAESLNETFHAYYDTPSAANTNALISALAQFSHFKDESGTGRLFTADVYGDADADQKVVYLPVFDDLEFVYGTTLDLSDNISFQVKDLTGSPTVVNAVEFRITNNWTICAADFPRDDGTVRHPLTVDGKLVFAEGATFSVDNELTINRSSAGIVVATATGGIVGKPKQAAGLAKRWKMKIEGNVARLYDSSGLKVFLR